MRRLYGPLPSPIGLAVKGDSMPLAPNQKPSGPIQIAARKVISESAVTEETAGYFKTGSVAWMLVCAAIWDKCRLN